jgi:hypothetical protein
VTITTALTGITGNEFDEDGDFQERAKEAIANATNSPTVTTDQVLVLGHQDYNGGGEEGRKYRIF